MAFDIVLRDNGTNDFDIAFGAAAATVDRDARLSVEWAGFLERNAEMPIDFLSTAQRDARLPIELGAPVQLSRDALLPIELRSPVVPEVLGNWIGVVGAVALGTFRRDFPTPYYTNKSRSTRPRPRAVPRRRRAREVRAAVITHAVVVRPMRRALFERVHVPVRRAALVASASFVDAPDEDALVLLL